MTYRRAIIGRWSRRDILSVVVIALAVAFLTGTVLLVVTAGDQTTQIAAEYDTGTAITTHNSISAAEAAATANATVVPFTVVTDSDNNRHHVVSQRPAQIAGLLTDNENIENQTLTLGTATEKTTIQLTGPATSIDTTVHPRNDDGLLPPSWYVTSQATVEELGTTGAFTVHEAPNSGIAELGVPVRAALAFFVFGTSEALQTLTVVAGGSALLVAVVVYSVTRMAVRDRHDTLKVIRSTGGSPITVLGLFLARAGLLTVAGAALGYAVGVIAVNATVNLAVFVGLPTSLAPQLTPAAAGLLAIGGAMTILIGALSGGLAAWPVIRCEPAEIGTTRRRDSRLANALSLSVLDARAFVPTAATLTAFVAFVVLVAGVAGVIGPLMAEGATITEPDAIHPVASSVPATYAGALRSHGIDASPEILLFESRDGQPYAARGANYSAFTTVTESELVSGREPEANDEAVVGQDLATTLQLSPGDSLTLGGSTDAGVDRVQVVGIFAAPGPYDDQVIVPLPVARHLGSQPSGQVHFVRADRLPESEIYRQQNNTNTNQDGIVDVTAPATVPPNQSLTVDVTVRNTANDDRTIPVEVTLGNRSVSESVTVAGGQEQRVSLTLESPPEGHYQLHAGHLTQSIEVVSRDTIQIRPLPTHAPANTTLQVITRTPYGDPISNATITVDDQSVQTDKDGEAWVQFNEPGERRIVARIDNQSTSENITVDTGVERPVKATANIKPEDPDTLTQPTVHIQISNPWNTTLERSYEISGPGNTVHRSITVGPGANQTVEVPLTRQPPGEYTVTIKSPDGTTQELSYTVIGDDRIAAALSSSGASGSSGIAQAIEAAFGNLQLVIAVVLGLASLMTVGGTTASFAQAVHAQRREIGIYRATGASPVQLFKLVIQDAMKIGIVGTIVAVIAGLLSLQALSTAGYLTVFGVRLSTIPSPQLLIGIVLGALIVTILGAGLATLTLLRADPYQLFSSRSGPVTEPREEGEL